MLETTSAAARTGATRPARRGWRRRWESARPDVGTAPALPGIGAAPTSPTRREVRVVGVVAAAAVGRVGHRHRPAGARRDVERERPLVVSRGTAVAANRGLRALASNANHSAGDRAARLQRARLQRSVAPGSGGLSGARSCGTRSVDPWLLAGAADQGELAVGRHRVLVLLAQEPALDERVDARGKGIRDVRVFEFEESDRAGVLLATEDQLGFFFASRFVPPDRHRDRQQDRHDGESNQQGRHRVPALRVLTA